MCRSLQTESLGCSEEPKVSNPEDLQRVLEKLAISDISHFELEDMFEEGLRCMQECSSLVDYRPKSNSASTEKSELEELEGQTETSQSLPLKYLISGSESFRSSLLTLETDAVFCAMIESVVPNFVTPDNLRMLAEGGKEMQEHRIGQMIYSSRMRKDGMWYILSSGRLKVSLDNLREDKAETTDFELTAGEIFGGYCAASCKEGTSQIKIRTVQPCNIIELQGSNLKTLLQNEPDSAGKLLLMMGGNNLF